MEKPTIADKLQALQNELTELNQSLITAVGGERDMLEAWVADLRAKLAALSFRR